MSKTINIGTTIDLEKLIDTRLLIQAGSGGGKSYALRKVIESVGASCQQIILDPEGEFVTLREKYDFALVSKGGDIPISIKYAETLAHKLLETNVSAIIDLYELKQHERITFVKRFLDALINAPKELWHSCLVYVDEAHIFCPESSRSESMSSVIDLCTRGRKRGFTAVLATQRLSKLHKDAAAECLNKMIGRTGLDIDRKRAGDELGMTGKFDMLSLRDLQPGEFYCFGPAISHEVKKVKVSNVSTTHLRAGKRMVTNPPTPSAIKGIISKLKDIPEEAEKELITKQQLQSEVTKLRVELTKAKKTTADPDEIKNLKGLINVITNRNNQLDKSIAEYEQKIQSVAKIIGTKISMPQPYAPIKLPELKKAAVEHKPSEKISVRTATGSLPTGEKKVLIAASQYENGVTRQQLTVLTAYKRSSRDAYIQRLKEKGFVRQNGERIISTDEGVGALGNDFERLPQGVELQEYWLQMLPAGEKAILSLLIPQYPQSVNREILSERTGYQRSSRDAYIQRMVAKELVVAVGRGEVKASDNLF